MLEKFHSLNEIIAGSSRPDVAKLLSRLKKAGKVVRIAPRVYTTNQTDSPENIVRRRLESANAFKDEEGFILRF